MKKLIFAAMACLPAMAFAQTGKYLVQGTVGDYNAPAKVYLDIYLNGKENVDSAVINKGKFQFAGSVGTSPVTAYLMLNQKGTGPSFTDYKMIYLEQGVISIISSDLMANAKIDGPKANQDNERYQAGLKPIIDKYSDLEAKTKAATPEQRESPSFKKAYDKSENAIFVEQNAYDKKFVQDNPDSYVSLNALESYAYSADYADIAPLFNSFSDALKQSINGKAFAVRLPKLKAVAFGATAPEFAEADTAGKVISLSSFRGKYVLIDFWASWCGPCRLENPNVVIAFNRYKNKNFTIIGISLDKPDAKENWLAAIHKDGLIWTQLSDLQYWKSKTADLYAVRGIPQNFLIDPKGKIIGKNLRGEALENKLAELLGKIQ